jgi:hypothetical protein
MRQCRPRGVQNSEGKAMRKQAIPVAIGITTETRITTGITMTITTGISVTIKRTNTPRSCGLSTA